MGRSYA